MPPFREGPIIVDKRLDGELLHELRDAGHGRRINIVDASYDIPENSRVLKFPGTSAEALLGIVRLIPVEENSVITMIPDLELHNVGPTSVVWHAARAFAKTKDSLKQERLLSPRVDVIFGDAYRHDDVLDGLGLGFYSIASNPAERHLFIRTVDDLPFACASLVVGHSQKTE